MAPRKALKHFNTPLPDDGPEGDNLFPAKRKRAAASGVEKKVNSPPARATRPKAKEVKPTMKKATVKADAGGGPTAEPAPRTSPAGRAPVKRTRNPKGRPIPKLEDHPQKDEGAKPAKKSRPKAVEKKAGTESAEKLETKPRGKRKIVSAAADSNDVDVSTRTRRKNAQARPESEVVVKKPKGKVSRKKLDEAPSGMDEISDGNADRPGKPSKAGKVNIKAMGRKREKKNGPVDKRALINVTDENREPVLSHLLEESVTDASSTNSKEPAVFQGRRKTAKEKVVGAPEVERPKARAKIVARDTTEAQNKEYHKEDEKDTSEENTGRENVIMPEATKKKRGRGKVNANAAVQQTEEDKVHSEESDLTEKVSTNSADLVHGDVAAVKLQRNIEGEESQVYKEESSNKSTGLIENKNSSISRDFVELVSPNNVVVPFRKKHKEYPSLILL